MGDDQVTAVEDTIGWGGVGEEPPVDLGYTAYEREEKPQEVPSVDDKKTEAKPEPRKHSVARTDGSEILTLFWGGCGTALVKSGFDKPVGRMMQFQATLAGATLDEFFAGTLIDKFIIQPMARSADKAGALGAIVGGPLLIGIYERQPETGPLLEPFIRAICESTLVEMEPLITKRSRKTKRAAEAIARMRKEFNIPDDMDPIDAVLNMVFRDDEPTPPNDQEEKEDEGI